jgi:hypothetical protein
MVFTEERAQFEFIRRADRGRFVGEFLANTRRPARVVATADGASSTSPAYSVLVEFDREERDLVLGMATSCAGLEAA